jgi:hypothetical protein
MIAAGKDWSSLSMLQRKSTRITVEYQFAKSWAFFHPI